MEINHEQKDTKGAFYTGNANSKTSEMTYSKAGDSMIIIDHTEVSDELRGTGTGKKLVQAAVDYAREAGIKILPLCPFAKSVFDKNPELKDVLS